MGFKSTNTNCLHTAINFESDSGNVAPEWWEIIPAGKFKGLDGRKWKNFTPQSVIDWTLRRGRKVVVDINHSTHLKGEKGEHAPAQGKILPVPENWKVVDGAVYGRPALNTNGKKLMSEESYHGYSPVFDHDKAGNVLFVRSIGLTNSENLLLTALNSEGPQTQGKKSMSTIALAIATALNLEATASEEDAVNAITKLKNDRATALNRELNPPVDKFVPIEDYKTAMNRAEEAETSLKAQKDEDRKTAINAEIKKALEDGKISPASKDYHTAACQEEGGLERFKKFAESAPKLVVDSDLDEKDPEKNKSKTALNAEQKIVCDQLGLTAEEYLGTENKEGDK